MFIDLEKDEFIPRYRYPNKHKKKKETNRKKSANKSSKFQLVPLPCQPFVVQQSVLKDRYDTPLSNTEDYKALFSPTEYPLKRRIEIHLPSITLVSLPDKINAINGKIAHQLPRKQKLPILNIKNTQHSRNTLWYTSRKNSARHLTELFSKLRVQGYHKKLKERME